MNRNDIRVTYAVDRPTVATIDHLAKEWGVSKSEAMRRAVRIARERMDTELARMSPAEVLNHYRERPTRTEQEMGDWQGEARSIRKSWGDDPDNPS